MSPVFARRVQARSSLDTRLQLEQRLLAALFLWPREIDLDAHHFASQVHAALFFALQELGGAIWGPDGGLQRVIDVLDRECETRMFASSGGVTSFVCEQLPLEWATEDAIDTLVEQVRACPRCGR